MQKSHPTRGKPLASEAGTDKPHALLRNALTGPTVVAIVAAYCVLLTSSPSHHGPGVTCDEYYDVAAGKRLVRALIDQKTAFFQAENIEANSGPLTRHPPLGRWLLGWVHAISDPRPDDLRVVSVVAARLAPALCFGVLIVLIGWVSGRGGNPLRGTIAAATVALTPRVFGHAHLATLDMFTATFFVAAIVALTVVSTKRPRMWHAAAAGVVWGLALLTKMHGFLLLFPATLWFFWHFRFAAVRLWVAWFVAGLGTFLVGWPWLWQDPWGRTFEYLSTATERQSLHTFYLGRVWADIDVPWHYPWVMFVVTLPLGLLLLGGVGLWFQRRQLASDPLRSLALGCLVFVLLVFSVPKTPVYDGVRLFLMVFPLWAIFVGDGAQCAIDWLKRYIHRPRVAEVLVTGFVLFQGIGIVAYHPFQLSQYNVLVGGLPGAERLGFEVTYWGDTITGDLLNEAHRVAPAGSVLFAPHLAPFQTVAVAISTPELESTRLVGWDPQVPSLAQQCNYALVYRRKADWEAVAPLIKDAEVIAEVNRMGVWLARLYRLREGEAER